MNSGINLNFLTKEVRVSSQQLSKLINQYSNKNFKDFINYYRVKKSQESLVDKNNAHLTILFFAMECEFNSLSSFNSIFKKVRGITHSANKRVF